LSLFQLNVNGWEKIKRLVGRVEKSQAPEE